MPDEPPQRPARRLPAGRHGLSRGEVERNQRERILAAVAEAAAARGYAAMTVEDIVGRAGLSRRTFYEQFRGGKEEAFLAAYEATTTRLMAQVRAAYAAATTPREGVASSLRAFLSFVAAEPAVAEMCVVEVLSAGPPAIARRDAALKLFVALFEEAASELPPARRPPPLAAETVVGGIYEVVYSRLLHSGAASVPELLPALVYCALLPYFGYEVALEEYRRWLAQDPA